MGSHVGNRVLLLGASMAGLLAARVLAEHFTEVLLVDRDELTEVTGYRRGVPHGRHAHGLVARGQQILEAQFPGLTNELHAAGVVPGDFSADVRWHFNGTLMAKCNSGLVCVPAIRPVLEYHVRRRVAQIPNVTFLERCDIIGLQTTPDRSQVIGARVQRQEAGSQEEVLLADLVIDVTGRGSRTPAWLEELGYQRPQDEKVRIDLAYTTRHYQLRSDPFGTDLAIIPAATPQNPRGAFFHKIVGGKGRIEISLTGLLGDHPPTDPDGFLAFVKSLPVPDIYEAIRIAEPLNDPVMFKFPVSTRRHYERLTQFPRNYLVMGDAVCSFNPVYAQGMTVSALESLVLARHLQGGNVPDATAFFADVSREIDSPWDFTVGADLGYPGVEGKRTAQIRFANAYVAKLQNGAAHDPKLSESFIRVAGLIEPPQSILRPGTILRVLRHGWRKPPAVVSPPAAHQAGPAENDGSIDRLAS